MNTWLTLALIFISYPIFSKAQIPHLSIELTLTEINNFEYVLKAENLPQNYSEEIHLNPGLNLQVISSDQLQVISRADNHYKIIDDGNGVISFKVSGKLLGSEISSDKALILYGSTQWLPLKLDLFTYELSLTTQKTFPVFSPAKDQGACGANCRYFADRRAQEDLYLVIGDYYEFKQVLPNGKTMGVLLFDNDPSLAESYLKLLPEYLQRYENLFGPYLYHSFYVVENFAETGYGMSGFTLLGPSVIRLPFILKSSLPHEVLHNWWGNGVYIDYAKGNWAEGLTTYGADHLEQQIAGSDVEYRRDTLLGYQDFVSDSANNVDFPLRTFQGRHNEASQSVGYGKGMMFFHMMKKWVGEANFNLALQEFYKNFQFKKAGFSDLVDSFSKVSGATAGDFANPWLDQVGSVTLSYLAKCNLNQSREIEVRSQPDTFSFQLPYKLVTAQGSELQEIKMISGQGSILLPPEFKGRIELDPNYDVFRSLSQGERPITFSRVLGSTEVLVVIQTGYEKQWQEFSLGLQTAYQGKLSLITEADFIKTKPKQPVIFFGHNFASLKLFDSLFPKDIQRSAVGLQVAGKDYVSNQNGWMMMVEDLKQAQVLVWLSPSLKHDNQAWGRQLTHYTKFGALVFEAKKNIFKKSYASGVSDLNFEIAPCL